MYWICWAHVCVHVYMRMCARTCPMWTSTVGLLGLVFFFLISNSDVLREDLSLNLVGVWLTKSQKPTCLLPISGIIVTCHHVSLCMWMLTTELRSSHLQSKCFTHRTILQQPKLCIVNQQAIVPM